MIKKFFLPVVLISLLFAWNCGLEQKEPAGPGDGDSTLTGKELIDRLESQAVEESDIGGRLLATVVVLQEEFSKSEKLMPGLKEVEVKIGADCILTISNRAFGKETTSVNLKDLDPNGFSLIPDLNEGDFPGLRIQTKGGAPAVEVLKNGVLSSKKTELVLYLANRPAIERITPYMLQALNICQGMQYPD